MAAKLTFESKLVGMEQVLDQLKRAEERLNDVGRVGSYALEGVSERFKQFQTSLETINKSQNGVGGLFKSFDEMNKRSNEFLGKSYKTIIDAMKQEVKSFEGEVDKIKNKVDEAERSLQSFKSRRASMSEQEYQQGLASLTREKSTLQAESVAFTQQRNEMQREVFMRQQLPQGITGPMTSMGLGQYSTVGGAISGLPYLALAPAAIAKTVESISKAGLQYQYTRELNTELAQARLVRGTAAEGMRGDPTTYLAQMSGGGIERQVMDSKLMTAKIISRWALDNPLIGMAAGAGGGALAGGLAGLATGGVMSIPLAIGGAISGGLAGFGSAQNRTRAQIEAEERMSIRGQAKELYGVLGERVGGNFEREGQELGGVQRVFGVRGSHDIVMRLERLGQSLDRAVPAINMLAQQGTLRNGPGAMADLSTFINRANQFGMSENVQRALVRSAAVTGNSNTDAQTQLIRLYAGAGLTGLSTGDRAAQQSLSEYAAQQSATRGGVSADLGVAAGPAAAAMSMNQPGFNQVEGVGQAISVTESVNKMMQSGGGAMDMIYISKMRQLGITNAVIIDAFIKLNPRLTTTQQRMQAYLKNMGRDVKLEDIQKAMSGDVQTLYGNMYGAVIGKKELAAFQGAKVPGEKRGVDLMTLQTTDVRTAENTATGGVTFGQAIGATGGLGNAGAVSTPQETTADIRNKEQARLDVEANRKLEEVLAKTGQEVTDALTKAIVKGFADTADQVKKAGDALIRSNTPTPSTATFGGVKAIGKILGHL